MNDEVAVALNGEPASPILLAPAPLGCERKSRKNRDAMSMAPEMFIMQPQSPVTISLAPVA